MKERFLENIIKKKIVIMDPRAEKSLKSLPALVKEEIVDLIIILEIEGRLAEPEAKKLNTELYEIRVRLFGSWRAIYAYLSNNRIVVLNIFQKKSQKTPINEIKTAQKRLKQYI